MPSCNDFVVSVFKNGYLPYTYLYSEGSRLTKLDKRYVLRDVVLSSENSQTEFCYIVDVNGSISLTCTRSLKTKSAFDVLDGGSVNIYSWGNVSLTKDVIESGGNMEVCSPNTILKSGFEVKKGGILSISAKNNK